MTRPPKISLAKRPFSFLILKLFNVLGTERLHATIRCFFFFPILQEFYSFMKTIHFGYAAFPIRGIKIIPFLIPLGSLCVDGALFSALAPQAVHLVVFFASDFIEFTTQVKCERNQIYGTSYFALHFQSFI